MFSKLLNVNNGRVSAGFPTSVLFGQGPFRDPRVTSVRKSTLIPPTQYDIPFPKKMQLGTLLKNNWEIIPLFSVTAFAIAILFVSVGWAVKTKTLDTECGPGSNAVSNYVLGARRGDQVDVSFTHKNNDTLSRTMDLRNPPTLKLITINQKYEPWPEMQDAIDKIRDAESKLHLIMNNCKMT